MACFHKEITKPFSLLYIEILNFRPICQGDIGVPKQTDKEEENKTQEHQASTSDPLWTHREE